MPPEKTTVIWLVVLGLLAAVWLAFGALNVVLAPTLTGWKLAILATEFGQWLCLGAVLTAVLAARACAPGWPRVMIIATCLVAVGHLLKPTFQAWRLSRTLEPELRRAWPRATTERPPFRFGTLWHWRRATPVASETFDYARHNDVSLKLDFYRAQRAAGAGAAPCVVVVHGGGWDNGDRSQLPELNHVLAAEGYAVAAINYRLAPRGLWPAQREDVAAALDWLRAHASELGLDPERFVLLGRSAGAHIALATAYRPETRGVRGVIGFYGPTDMHFTYAIGEEDDLLRSLGLLRAFLGGTPEQRRAEYDDASPLLHVRADQPPTLLLHGAHDTLVWHRQSERLIARINERGARGVFVSLPWATHAFDFNLRGPGGQIGLEAVRRFLEETTGSRAKESGDR